MLSTGTEAIDRGAKMRRYAASRIPYDWIIYPATRTLEAYRLQEDGYALTGTCGPGAGPCRSEFRVYPAPFGPTIAPVSPGRIWRLTPLSTGRSAPG